MLGNFACFCRLLIFFSPKHLFRIPSECQTVRIQIRPEESYVVGLRSCADGTSVFSLMKKTGEIIVSIEICVYMYEVPTLIRPPQFYDVSSLSNL